jgi:hypothetical protein
MIRDPKAGRQLAYKTHHEALYHETNVRIVETRNMEIKYWTSVYGAMGVQCAFLGSVAVGCISHTPVRFSKDTLELYSFFYWVPNSLVSITGLFALTVSLFVIVYGQGLALRGPSGSMVRPYL